MSRGWRSHALMLSIVSAMLMACAWVSAASDDEAAFLAENSAAMSKMMSSMAVTPSGDVDKAFVAAMIPHHQVAIEMAQAELRYGRDERLRRIAQETIVDQVQEIDAMRKAIEDARK